MNIDTKHPTEAFLRGIDIHELLPQQEPFVMISRLVHFDMVRAVTETDICPEHIFTENGFFTASGLIENIAQTCAARMGYVNKYIFEKDVQIGFIGAIRQMEIYDLPPVGQTISTLVDVKEEIFGMTLAEAQVKLGNKLLAKTEIKIAIKGESSWN
jgi:predicted hotdog family 3-hydroxylacyl-ACP dehydratase